MINNHTLTKYTLANDCKRALNTRGNLVFRYRIYHPKQSLTFLSCSSTSYLAFHSQYTNSSSAKRSSLSSLENIANCSQSGQAVISHWVAECARSKFISESFKSKLNSDSSDEKEIILKQNLDVLVPKYIGMINFACHLLEQTERVDWGAIVFGPWVDVISNWRPRHPKTPSCNTSKVTLRGHRKSRTQANSKLFAPKCFE